MGTSLIIKFNVIESLKTVSALITSIVTTSRSTRTLYRHPCILVGHVIDGSPVSGFNRRVLWLRLDKKTVETGDVGAVKAGKGDIVDVEFLGRVTTPLEGNLRIVQKWVENGFENALEEPSLDAVIDDIKTCIARSKMSASEKGNIQLDIFMGTIVNHMADGVFVFREPRSF